MMKKALIISLLFTVIISCNQNEQSGTLLTGTVDNPNEAYFILGGPGGSRDTIPLTENNSFDYGFEQMEEPGNYYIMSGDEVFTMYVAPGMQLDVYFDLENFNESVNFAGTGANLNNYLADKARLIGSGGSIQEVFTREPQDFIAYADSAKEAKQNFLNDYPKDDSEHVFWHTERANILYGWGQDYANYPMYYQYFNEGETVDLPEDFSDYKNELDVNKPKYLGSAAFTRYVNEAVRTYAADKAKELDSVNRNLLNLQLAPEVISDPDVLGHYLLKTIVDRMQWADLSDLQEEIDFFKANCSDADRLAEFSAEYDSWVSLSKGQPAIEFVGEDLEGNQVKLSDFLGQYVYVDVWATWCGPCKVEIPHLKQLEADYHDRNIVFLSYSIDADKQAWLDFVPENELGGVQIIGENAWQSDLAKNYRIKGVPTFMLIDPDGNIISVKMTRPSNQATRDLFDSYSDL